MKEDLKYTLMVAGMVIAWSVYYAVSKVLVDLTGSPLAAGFLLRSAALVFLTVQLLLDGNFSRLFHQGKAVTILLIIGWKSQYRYGPSENGCADGQSGNGYSLS